MIKYHAEEWRNTIIAVEVEKESEHSVWINGRTRRKVSDGDVYVDTWEQAQEFLMKRAQGKMDRAKSQYDYEKARLGNVKGMKKPD